MESTTTKGYRSDATSPNGLERRHPCLHERRFDAKEVRESQRFTQLKNAALQAGMPALQSKTGRASVTHDPLLVLALPTELQH